MRRREKLTKYLIYLCIVFIISAITVIYIVQETVVKGNSMALWLKDGDSVLVNKTAYLRDGPERFDVIVFRYLYKDNEYYIKRVIGLPGETIQIKDGAVYINDEKLKDPYASISMDSGGRAEKPVTLGDDEYFVLGDNRNFSSDSREYDVGNVKRVQILGKAAMKLRSGRH